MRLKNIPGVGKKIADRVMLELRDKVQGKQKEKTGAAQPFMEAGNAFPDAFSALVNLGYRPAEAEKALRTNAGKRWGKIRRSKRFSKAPQKPGIGPKGS